MNTISGSLFGIEKKLNDEFESTLYDSHTSAVALLFYCFLLKSVYIKNVIDLKPNVLERSSNLDMQLYLFKS